MTQVRKIKLNKYWIKCRLEHNNIKNIGIKDFIDLYKGNKDNQLIRIIGNDY